MKGKKRNSNSSKLRTTKSSLTRIRFLQISFFVVLLMMACAGVYTTRLNQPQSVLGAHTTASCNSCQWWNIFCRFGLSKQNCNKSSSKSEDELSHIPISSVTGNGIYEFGQPNTADTSKSYLSGATLLYFWSQIEPTKGHYNWDQIRKDMVPWIRAGKKVIIRISTSGNYYANQPGSDSRTPQFVYDDGARFVTQQVTGGTEKHPAYWDQAYLNDFQTFLKAYAEQFDNDPHVAYIDLAIANDGETMPSKGTDTQTYPLWQSIGYSDQIWLDTITKIIALYGQSFHNKPIAVQPDRTFITPKTVKGKKYSEEKLLQTVIYLKTQYPNLIFQNDSLFPNQNLTGSWQDLPLSLEQAHEAFNSTTLQQEINTAIAEHGKYLLVFTKNIDDPKNQTILQNANKTFGY